MTLLLMMSFSCSYMKKMGARFKGAIGTIIIEIDRDFVKVTTSTEYLHATTE